MTSILGWFFSIKFDVIYETNVLFGKNDLVVVGDDDVNGKGGNFAGKKEHIHRYRDKIILNTDMK